jgi:hypothetical protein
LENILHINQAKKPAVLGSIKIRDCQVALGLPTCKQRRLTVNQLIEGRQIGTY